MTRKRDTTVRIVIAIQVIVILAGLAVILLSVKDLGSRVTFIQESRQKSAQDNCYLFRTVVLVASGPDKRQEALAFLDRIGLHNCVAYGLHVRLSR